jgi:Uncharacterized conserved protein
MARPKPDFPPAAALLALADDRRRLALRVTPGARSEQIALGEGAVLIKVRAKAHDGEANAAVLAMLARALGLPLSKLHLLRGATGRDKLVQIDA